MNRAAPQHPRQNYFERKTTYTCVIDRKRRKKGGKKRTQLCRRTGCQADNNFRYRLTFVARTTCAAIVPVARQVLEKLFVNFTYTSVTFTLVVNTRNQQTIKHFENIFHFLR